MLFRPVPKRVPLGASLHRLFFFNHPATPEIYTLPTRRSSDLPGGHGLSVGILAVLDSNAHRGRSEEHTSELQSLRHLVCRLLLEKKKIELSPVDEGGTSASFGSRDDVLRCKR